MKNSRQQFFIFLWEFKMRIGTLSVLFLALFMLRPAQGSEWVQAVQSQSGSFWVKVETVLKVGSKLSVQQLTEFKERQSTGEKSSISFLEINCSNMKIRETRAIYYSGSKASGRVISDDNLVEYGLAKWRKTASQTADGLFAKVMCENF